MIYDAEHFFDGFKRNREYALATLRAAEAAGAHCLVLCDTNGGSIPAEITAILREVKKVVKPESPLGIHVHNDTECAVANTLAAVEEGVNHVQGTINGYGERCGNANLVSIIPNLMLKMGLDSIPREHLRDLRDVSRFVSELANRKPWSAQPYVGDSAFAHKGGIHVSAVLKHPDTYEHVDPGGGRQSPPRARVRAGGPVEHPLEGAGVRHRPRQEHPGRPPHPRQLKRDGGRGLPVRGGGGVLRAPDGARARATTGRTSSCKAYRVIVEEQGSGTEPVAEATVKLRVKGIEEHTAASGNGPVNALDHALRKALEDFYPNLRQMSLLDYKVRILDESKATAAKTRVLITSGDGDETWGTVGVADNIIEASWQALVDSVEYKLRRDERRGQR